MRISIWQQFSSNHSANFTVVGQFENPSKAAEAATKLREILQHIVDFDAGNYNLELTWPEQEYAKQYEVEWTQHLDWIYSPLEKHVVLLDNYLIVSNLDHQPQSGPKPMDELVRKLGGEIQLEGEYLPTVIYVDLAFKAPDEATANKIFNELEFYIEQGRRELGHFFPIPWIQYGRGYKHPEAERILHLERNYKAHQKAEYEWNKQHQNEQNPRWREIKEIEQRLRSQSVTERRKDQEREQRYRELILEHNTEREKYLTLYPILSFEESSFLHDEVGWLDASPLENGGNIHQSGTQLHISKLWFLTLGLGLPAFIAWVKDQGCTDIEYRFFELPH